MKTPTRHSAPSVTSTVSTPAVAGFDLHSQLGQMFQRTGTVGTLSPNLRQAVGIVKNG
jgi:hypothetical protein